MANTANKIAVEFSCIGQRMPTAGQLMTGIKHWQIAVYQSANINFYKVMRRVIICQFIFIDRPVSGARPSSVPEQNEECSHLGIPEVLFFF